MAKLKVVTRPKGAKHRTKKLVLTSGKAQKTLHKKRPVKKVRRAKQEPAQVSDIFDALRSEVKKCLTTAQHLSPAKASVALDWLKGMAVGGRSVSVQPRQTGPIVIRETKARVEPKQRVILLPPRGLRGDSSQMSNDTGIFFRSLHRAVTSQRGGGGSAMRTIAAANVRNLNRVAPNMSFQVLKSITDNGAKLIEISPSDLADLRMAQPGLRIVPIIEYEPSSRGVNFRIESAAPSPAPAGIFFTVTTKAGKPVPQALVVAFTDFASRQGDQATTDRSGQARLALPAVTSLERVYIYPHHTYWPRLLMNLKTSKSMSADVEEIVLPYMDGQRYFYQNDAADEVGKGVTVGVIDTGCGPHPDLVIAGGYSTVGSDPTKYQDNGEQHGTHVAGIIAARGSATTSVRGIAPGVTLRSYRVFAAPGEKTTNFDIADAVDRARRDKCDLINMSLKQSAGQVADDALRAAIEDARNAGMLPIAAAGNDGRQPVAFPASDDLCIAVSAMGRQGTFPKTSVSAASVTKPPDGKDPNDFIADFSNVGSDVDVTGPGVGTISTVPGGAFAVMDGTSMACPVVTGIAARLLAQKRSIINMDRDSHRADAIAQLLLGSAVSMGFGAAYEGRGRPS